MIISPWVFLCLMTCPVDPLKLYSHAVIFYITIWVIGIEALDLEGIFLDLLCVDIRVLEILYLI